MRYTAVITREDTWHVVHCLDLGIVTQGRTIEEAQANLREAVELYIESFGDEVRDTETSGEVLIYPLEVGS